MKPFTRFASRLVPLPAENVDTDQIIPARYLKVTDKNGLGEALFADWRYAPDGSPRPEFVLNRPEMAGRQILIAGDNFGCGSSREHAPWALTAFGFRTILSTSFADIFRSNALKNGLLPVVLPTDVHQAILATLEEEPDLEIVVDLEAGEIRLPTGQEVSFETDPFARHCLLQGVDQLGYLLEQLPAIEQFEAARAPWK